MVYQLLPVLGYAFTDYSVTGSGIKQYLYCQVSNKNTHTHGIESIHEHTYIHNDRPSVYILSYWEYSWAYIHSQWLALRLHTIVISLLEHFLWLLVYGAFRRLNITCPVMGFHKMLPAMYPFFLSICPVFSFRVLRVHYQPFMKYYMSGMMQMHHLDQVIQTTAVM